MGFDGILWDLPFSSQTWLAGKSPELNGGFAENHSYIYIYIYGPFSSKPCLMTPEGIWLIMYMYIYISCVYVYLLGHVLSLGPKQWQPQNERFIQY